MNTAELARLPDAGAMERWALEPGTDPLFAVVFACAAFGVLARECIRRWRGRSDPMLALRIVLRAAGIGLITMLLLSPGRWVDSGAPARPQAILAVDGSRSMALRDESSGLSRLEMVQQGWLSEDALAAIEARADLRILRMDDAPEPLSASEARALTATGDRSNLVASIVSLVRERRPEDGAVPRHLVLLSDGVDTSGVTPSSLAAALSRSGFVLHTIRTPAGSPESDVSLSARADRDWVSSGARAKIRVVISGGGTSGDATLTLREDDENGAIIAQRRIAPGARRIIDLDVQPVNTGPIGSVLTKRYHASIRVAEGDRDPSNNADAALLQVTSALRRVLVIEASPSWDTRFLIDALARDAGFEIVSMQGVARSTGPGAVRVTRVTPGLDATRRAVLPVAPLSPAEIATFDVIVLGASVGAMLEPSAIEAVHTAIESEGRSLVMIDLDDVPAELGRLAPIDLDDRSTRELRGVWLEQPGLGAAEGSGATASAPIDRLVVRAGAMRPLAQPLLIARSLDGDEAAVMVESPAGTGRVAAVLVRGLWRSRMRTVDPAAEASPSWAALLRGLIEQGPSPPGAPVSMALARMRLEPGESQQVYVRARRGASLDDASLVMEGPAGERVNIPLAKVDGEPWRAQAAVRADKPGVHRLTLSLPNAGPEGEAFEAQASFDIRRTDLEADDPAPGHERWRELVMSGGGGEWGIDEARAFAESIEREASLRRDDPVFEPMWNRPAVYALIVLLLGAEWWLRRRNGLA